MATPSATLTAPEFTDETGLVPVATRRQGRKVISAHVWRGDGTRSVCGRWTIEQLDPDLRVTSTPLTCGVCVEHAPRFT